MAANLKQQIKRGEQVVGFGIRGDIERDAFRRIVELGACDFVFTDSQHSPYSEDRLVALAGMAKELKLPLHFRIKHTRHTYLIGNHLDLGPSGIEVPQVETAATAEEAVANFYYLPQGVRSHGGSARVGWRPEQQPTRLCGLVEPIRGAVAASRIRGGRDECIQLGAPRG